MDSDVTFSEVADNVLTRVETISHNMCSFSQRQHDSFTEMTTNHQTSEIQKHSGVSRCMLYYNAENSQDIPRLN